MSEQSAAADAVGATEVAGVPSAPELVSGLARTLIQGRVIVRESAALTAELARIVAGASEITPERGDGRFKDPAWQENPAYRRLCQAYLALCSAADELVESQDGERQQAERARFIMNIVTSAVAPTNFLAGNPAALKRAFDTGGRSLVKGASNWAGDLRHNGGMPSMAKRGALTVGQDLAITPGAVVHRDAVAELIQYHPSTASVRARPTLVVPPPIGRYYFLDLRPGRSFVEYAVGRGLQTFLLSWRNPTAEQAHWSLDTYAGRVLTAVDAVREITGSEDVNVIGFCAGGIINTTVLNHLAATADPRIHTAAYAVTLLDFDISAPIGAFSSARLLDVARWSSRRAGVISARAMGGVFSWMRPNDLVWNYWVNNYLMGQDPPVFDILSWNADGTNLPAALHSQFLDIFRSNPLPTAGAMTVLGTPIDLATIKVPTYVTGAINDHLTPWRGCYRTTQLMSGRSTFALSNAGHIASLVNPPGNPKASYYTTDAEPGPDPDVWLEGAKQRTGSWWEHWADWAEEHSGEERPAPKRLGSRRHRVLADAPGLYVRDQGPQA
jgi:polyhydroxyalkanoate synthase